MTAPEPRPKFDLLRVLVAVALASVPVVLWYEGEVRAVREQLDVEASRFGPGLSPPHRAIDGRWSVTSMIDAAPPRFRDATRGPRSAARPLQLASHVRRSFLAPLNSRPVPGRYKSSAGTSSPPG
jgi:hypothetical protein